MESDPIFQELHAARDNLTHMAEGMAALSSDYAPLVRTQIERLTHAVELLREYEREYHARDASLTKQSSEVEQLYRDRDRLAAALTYFYRNGSWHSLQWLIIDGGIFMGCPHCRGRVHHNEPQTMDGPAMHEPTCVYRKAVELQRAVAERGVEGIADSASADGGHSGE